MRLPHVIPFAKAPLFFFTACTQNRLPLLANQQAFQILREIWQRSAEMDGWYVGRFVLMPDHIHFFARPVSDAKPREVWTKMWKSVSSRRLAELLGAESPFWQSDTFDHVLRSSESYEEKWNYVRENPVRAGFCVRVEDWPWRGELHPLSFR